jgi:putative addiction module component (TIGR02574 family)
MNTAVGSLLEQAKKLSAEERTALIDALHDISAPPDPAWEAAWIKECEERMAALDSGEMQAFDFDEVLAQARARLKQV